MWRRTYLVLLLIRVYFALSPSYLHPDENFQGPEVFAGRHFSYPSTKTWEFTSEYPIRSAFPLWPVYDVPMSLLKWYYMETGTGNPPPQLVYNVLRGVMFMLTFVLEDWAIYELVPSPRYRRGTMALVASSYVTWTFQTHTFSNSVETLLVAWGLVLIRRISEDKQRRSSLFSCAVLAFIAVAGIFNRITFPAFLVLPGFYLIPHFLRRPLSLLSFAASGVFFTFLAVLGDTFFYHPNITFSEAIHSPVITPLNNFRYNSDASNLASHGLHPRYQHLLANLPQLLGPAYIVIAVSFVSKSRKTLRIPSWTSSIRGLSALSATALLSIFPHQEPRFLLPCVPLLLSCLRVDILYTRRPFVVSWVAFNAFMGVLMGIYHQGGVIPTQLSIPSIVSEHSTANQLETTTVFWWKTYSPPRWLLGDQAIPKVSTKDLMGIPGETLLHELDVTVPACSSKNSKDNKDNKDAVFMVAPKSATFLDKYIATTTTTMENDPNIRLREVFSYENHLNLDDLDFGDDGVIPTLTRVIGRRGLGVWAVERACNA